MVKGSYQIRNTDGKLFCECQDTAAGLMLVTQNCRMPMSEFLSKAYGGTERRQANREKQFNRRKCADRAQCTDRSKNI